MMMDGRNPIREDLPHAGRGLETLCRLLLSKLVKVLKFGLHWRSILKLRVEGYNMKEDK